MQNKSILDPLVMAGYNVASQHPQFATNQQLPQQQDPSQMGANLINFSNPYFLAGLAQDSNISNAATYASKLANEEASRNYQNQQSAASQQEMAQNQLSQQRNAALQQILPSIISDLDPLDIVGNTSVFSKFMAPDKAVVFANALSKNAHDLAKEDIKDERALNKDSGLSFEDKERIKMDNRLKEKQIEKNEKFVEENDKKGKEVQTLISRLDSLDKYGKQFYQGTGAGLVYAKNKLNPFGGHKEAAAYEKFQADAKKVALDAGQTLKGSFSDKDITFLEEQGPQTNNLREGNKIIIDGLRRAGERELEYIEKSNQWLEDGGDIKSFEKEWRKYVNENPIFSDEEIAKFDVASDGNDFSKITDINEIDRLIAEEESKGK